MIDKKGFKCPHCQVDGLTYAQVCKHEKQYANAKNKPEREHRIKKTIINITYIGLFMMWYVKLLLQITKPIDSLERSNYSWLHSRN